MTQICRTSMADLNGATSFGGGGGGETASMDKEN